MHGLFCFVPFGSANVYTDLRLCPRASQCGDSLQCRFPLADHVIHWSAGWKFGRGNSGKNQPQHELDLGIQQQAFGVEVINMATTSERCHAACKWHCVTQVFIWTTFSLYHPGCFIRISHQTIPSEYCIPIPSYPIISSHFYSCQSLQI